MRTTAPGQSALLLLDVIDRLNKRHILYAVIGAFAASFYGLVRASLDADAVISIQTSQEGADLCRDLEGQGFRIEHRSGGVGDPIDAVINIHDLFRNRVDLLIGIHGMTQEVFHRVEQAQFMGSSIKIAGLEDFIAMKIFAGSPKDIQDVIGVLQVSKEKINRNLLEKLTAPYGGRCTAKLKMLLKEHLLGN